MQQLLDDQAGVVARRQLTALGLGDHDIRRLLRRRELVLVHPGVFVNHTGDPTWVQRAWAGVLYAWPAALSGESALRAAEGPGRTRRRDGDIRVAVAHHRKVARRPGLIIERRRSFEASVLWNLGPPRIRYEEAAIDLAAEAKTDLDACLEGSTTVRLGWGQVFDRPCTTAAKVARLLTLDGWTGRIHPCGPTCPSLGNLPVTG